MSCFLPGQHWASWSHNQACAGTSASPELWGWAANLRHSRCPCWAKHRGSGTGPEKGIKLSHLLSKQPNERMNHPQEAFVMPTKLITQHPSRKACSSGRLPVKIKQQSATLGCLSPFSPSAHHSSWSNFLNAVMLALSTFISLILPCIESCTLLHRFPLSTLAVLCWELTQQLWVMDPSYMHCSPSKVPYNHDLWGKKIQQVDIWKDTYEKTIQCWHVKCKPLNLSM